MTRSLAPRSLSCSSAGWSRRRPVQRTKAQSRSTVLADSISVLSSAARLGSSLLLVSRAESLSLVVGRRRLRRLRVSGRWRDWSWVGPRAMRSACVQLLEELVGEGDAFGGFGCGEGLADGVGDVAGEDVRAVFVVDVCEDWLEFCLLGPVCSPSTSVLSSSYKPSGSCFAATPPMKLVTAPGYCVIAKLPSSKLRQLHSTGKERRTWTTPRALPGT